MEMRVTIGGAGLSLPQSRVGANLVTGAYLQFRNAREDVPLVLGLGDRFSFGDNSGTLAVSHVSTVWYPVNVSRHRWLHGKARLSGRTAQLEVKGTVIGRGGVDIEFTVYDGDDYPKTLLERAMLDATGFQIAGASVRGTLKHISRAEEVPDAEPKSVG